MAINQTTAIDDLPGTAEASGVRPADHRGSGRLTSMTLGPFLVSLVTPDAADTRPDLAIAISYCVPSRHSDLAVQLVQARLGQLVRAGTPAQRQQDIAEHLYDGLAGTGWLGNAEQLAELGFRVTHVAVTLIPATTEPGRIVPLATVTVRAPDAA